ncbi:MAG TPA: hypothetical protein EYH08_02525 [Pyrodictium sp.]|nr:hypothetical protein [Pyrodictium sp.]
MRTWLIAIAIIVALIAGIVLGAITIPRTIVTTSIVTETSTLTVTTTTTTTEILQKPVIVVVDARGSTLKFETIPRRVVALTPAIAEIVCMLDCSRLVGVVTPVTYPPELVKAVEEGRVEVVGSYWSPDAEKILALKPDLVIADLGVPKDIVVASMLEQHGVKVLFVKGGKAATIDDIVADVMLVASVLNETKKAQEWKQKLDSVVDMVTKKLERANVTKPPTLVVLGPPSWGLWVAGGGTFIDSLLKVAGGVNVAGKYHGWVQLSYEDALKLNPSKVIVTVMGGREEGLQCLEAWKKTPLNNTKAFRMGAVCVVTGPADDAIVRPGPRIVDAIQILAYILHPDIFNPPANYTNHIVCLKQP